MPHKTQKLFWRKLGFFQFYLVFFVIFAVAIFANGIDYTAQLMAIGMSQPHGHQPEFLPTATMLQFQTQTEQSQSLLDIQQDVIE